ncbi:MAG: YaaR family protein [Clostridiaceae bacterium]|nr:YaaR family protein [Clostridiaceae bacterium]
MKIDGSNRRTDGLSGRINTGSRKVGEKAPGQFNTYLKRQQSEDRDEMLRKMAQDIIRQGERLSEKVDIAELKAYKRLISEFLEEAVRSFMHFSKESYMDRRGRHRLYATVKKVNEKLEELTKEVLSSERDHLKILGKIEDIRGLILDIIL